jgi:hypothetical protein
MLLMFVISVANPVRLVGEIFNFAAYAFAPAVLVTPLGALSVVVSAFLSDIFLKEKLNFAGKIGCAQCVIGAVIIVLHTPETTASTTIPQFISLVLAPAFLVYASFAFLTILLLIFYFGPRYGSKCLFLTYRTSSYCIYRNLLTHRFSCCCRHSGTRCCHRAFHIKSR